MKRKNIKHTAAAIGAASLIAMASASCGSSNGTGSGAGNLTSANLTKIPGANTMVGASSSSSSSRIKNPIHNVGKTDGFDLAVTGTPPLVTDLQAGADQYFWNGLAATINTAGSANAGQKDQFWGRTAGGPGGQGACYMAQSVGEAFGRILDAATSACYMRKMTQASSGVTITGSSASSVFEQADNDKIVKVHVLNMPGRGPNNEGGGEMNIYIRVKGKSVIGTDTYRAELTMCNGTTSTVTGTDILQVVKSTGEFTATSTHNEGAYGGSSTLTAFLSGSSDGRLTFDTSKTRHAVSNFGGSWGVFKSDVTITPDAKIYTKMRNSGTSYNNKTYSVSSFSGSSMGTLRFREAGYKATSTYNYSGSDHTETFSGGTQWSSSFYSAVSSSDLLTEANLIDLTTDSFYTGSLSAPSAADLSASSCSLTASITVEMDFSNTAVAAIQTACEGEKFTSYSMCNSSAIQSAQQKAY